MKANKLTLLFLTATLMGTSCASHYQLKSVERSRILVDSRYDANPDVVATAFLAPYKHDVDSMMSPVLGRTAKYLAADRPERELSNLLPDILIWGSKAYQESPDFAVYNIGGIRAAFAKGDVTVGDIIDVAPFENKICFVTLTGDKVLELFRQIAKRGGEGLSHGVELVLSNDFKLASAKLNGEEIEPTKEYRIATLDYLAQGNDGMDAFKASTNVVSPQDEANNVRFIIMDYFREMVKLGKEVDANIEGRVTVLGK